MLACVASIFALMGWFLGVKMLLGTVLRCSFVTKWVRYLRSESASLRGMDSDVTTNFTLSLRAGGSEGARGENLTAQSLRKSK